ncbi:MAG: hypothetical protein IPF54_20105 [Draconibacterium sp.]|nr:hypothetical protein [Draconibacterium sp.]
MLQEKYRNQNLNKRSVAYAPNSPYPNSGNELLPKDGAVDHLLHLPKRQWCRGKKDLIVVGWMAFNAMQLRSSGGI